MRSVVAACLTGLAARSAAYSLVGAPQPAVTRPYVRRHHAFVLMKEESDATEPPAEPLGDPPVELPEPEPVVDAVAEEEPAPSDVEESFSDFSDFSDAGADAMMDESLIAKEALKAEIADGLGGARPDKAVVGEILLALEAQNPTLSPATSPLLNGRWKFLYASGASPGLKALQVLLRGAKAAPKSPSGADLVDVQDTFLTIGAEQPRAVAETSVRLLSFENTIKLASRLDAESAVRLVETYDAAESDYLSLRVPFQTPVQYKRSVLVSYLDDEMLVVRDALGRPDILMRCEAAGSSYAPSEEADDAPGAS